MGRSSKEVLERSTTIAVVGASRDPNKAGGSVPIGLQRRGFRIIPINPFADVLFGEQVYRTLADVPEKIDLVDVFRASQYVPPIVEDVIKLAIPYLWLQEDVINDKALARARTAGVKCVQNVCIFREHAQRVG